ncbi:putative Palmitoyltransferase ZDHHC3 [Hypsibius exemplaris]|uniref:Palmitoyltransferase n=1 Tax=Hypsibius exemplaris TaxID=2072580 RepID=A0A1W0X8H0_HYPEX|nr:putative Palmitoyltransferase ZDHHC3 [Hypsibius exemplaris]
MVVILAYVCLMYADYVVVSWLILRHLTDNLWGAVHAVIFNICIFMAFFAHARCMLTDPGIIPRPENAKDKPSCQSEVPQPDSSDCPSTAAATLAVSPSPQPEGTDSHYAYSGIYLGAYPRPRGSLDPDTIKAMTICQRCDMYRPPRAHHCRTCQGCVRKMDHHCPWINNCVGAFNQKYFLQFLVWVSITSLYAGSIALFSWLADCPGCRSEPEATRHMALMHTVILAVESCLFGGFTLVMILDQMSAILKDETGIESLKRTGAFRPHTSRRLLLREACGPGTPLCWIFPCQSLNHQPIEETKMITTLV